MARLRPLLNLNPAQRAAVEHLHGPLLVIAGAGTGKTRVIVERINYLLESLPDLEGENILAVTYTDKAAAEMRVRIAQGGERARRVRVNTFHAYCYDLLRAHHQALQILEPVDYWIFLRRRLHELGLDVFKKLSEPGRFLNDFTDFFSRCQDELVSPEQYDGYVTRLAQALAHEKNRLGEDERTEREHELRRQQEIGRAYAVAERLLREANRTTFGGSLLSAVQLLQSNQELRRDCQEGLRYILVDEFQDANIAQITLLHLLSDKHRNLMVVGDDDQAIYRFRGASYASFRKFTELYPNTRRISLTHNYRSSARILRVATQLIAQNGRARFDPAKRLVANQPPGEKIQLAEVEDVIEEADHVRREIERLHKARGSYAGLTVLYRAHNHRNALVEALSGAGIPFVIRGLSVLNNPLVRDLLAYLRAIGSANDNISFTRLLAIPAWRLQPQLLLELVARARRQRSTLADAAESLHSEVRERHTQVGKLLTLLGGLRARAESARLSELLERLTEQIGLRLLPVNPDARYLDTFTNFIRQWEKEKSESGCLAEFLQYFDYFEEAGGAVCLPEDNENPDAVQLMTVHAAKGLEFDSVFVLRLNQNDFPTTRRRPLFVFPDKLMKEALPVGDFHVQEERRLCYVALTRARRHLALTSLTGNRKRPSVFLDDILRDGQVARQVTQISPPLSKEKEAAAPSAPGGQVELFRDGEPSAFYSAIGEWTADASDSAPPEPLTLSHSALETYSKCPLKYKLAHLWQLPGKASPAMVFGQVMHRCVVEFFRAKQKLPALPLKELRHIYDQQWRQTAWPFHDSYQEQEYRASGWQQLETFYENHGAGAAGVLELEKTFQWRWEDVVLTGRIDQINKLDGPGVEIVEYKTGEPRPTAKVEKSLQLLLYAQAAEQHLGLKPERLTLYNLTVNEPISFAPSEKNTTRLFDTVRDVAARIRARAFTARPGFHCRYCDYRLLCPAHEQRFPRIRISGKSENGFPENGGERNQPGEKK